MSAVMLFIVFAICICQVRPDQFLIICDLLKDVISDHCGLVVRDYCIHYILGSHVNLLQRWYHVSLKALRGFPRREGRPGDRLKGPAICA